MAVKCKLCQRQGASPPQLADTVLAETDNFVVTPSIGAILAGWVLVSPKAHILNFGELPERQEDELRELAEAVFAKLEFLYGRVVVFEHGPARAASPVGCTVDHAHIHMVPTSCGLRAGASQLISHPPLNWIAAPHIESARANSRMRRDYLYVKEDGREYIASHGEIGSQLLRKVVANWVGRPEQFDWRLFPQISNVEATVAAYTQIEDALSQTGAIVKCSG